MLPFERSEYLERLGETKRRMEAAGIDVLLVANEHNMNYLSGYDGRSSYVPQLLMVASDEEEPLWVGRAMDDACARNSVFMDHARIVGYPERYIGNPELHPMAFMADLLRERGWAKRRLGVELDTEPFSPHAYHELRRHLPDGRFVDAGPLVNWVRIVKSPQELTYMRQAGVDLRPGDADRHRHDRPGVRQCDAAAAVVAALIRGTDEFGGGCPASRRWRPDPLVRAAPDLDRRALQAGRRDEHRARRLSSSLPLRALPDDRRRRTGRQVAALAPTVAEGMAIALDAARPGVDLRGGRSGLPPLHDRTRRAQTLAHRLRHRQRLDRGDGQFGAGDKTVLEPNMTFHLMLGFWERRLGLCPERGVPGGRIGSTGDILVLAKAALCQRVVVTSSRRQCDHD